MTLEADGIIEVWDIDTGKVIAQYEGLEVHDAMQSIDQLNLQVDELWVQLSERDATIAVMQARLAAVPMVGSLGSVDGDGAP